MPYARHLSKIIPKALVMGNMKDFLLLKLAYYVKCKVALIKLTVGFLVLQT